MALPSQLNPNASRWNFTAHCTRVTFWVNYVFLQQGDFHREQAQRRGGLCSAVVADHRGWHIPQAAAANQDHTLRAKLLPQAAAANQDHTLRAKLIPQAAAANQDHTLRAKLRAMLYDLLPPTTSIVDYAVSLEKLSANEQFFDDTQTAVSL